MNTTENELQSEGPEADTTAPNAPQSISDDAFDEAMRRQLGRSDTEVVASLAKTLTESTGGYVSPNMVARWLKRNLVHKKFDRKPRTALIEPPIVRSGEKRIMNLTQLLAEQIDGQVTVPIAVRFPDGTQVPVRSWLDFSINVVRYLMKEGELPVPFEAFRRNRWFLNVVPQHKQPDARALFRAISVDGYKLFMDTDRSGPMFISDIHALCSEVEVAPEGFQVTING